MFKKNARSDGAAAPASSLCDPEDHQAVQALGGDVSDGVADLTQRLESTGGVIEDGEQVGDRVHEPGNQQHHGGVLDRSGDGG